MSADVDQVNLTLERYKLYQLRQKSGQRFDDFLLDITNQVDKCQFRSMRDQILLYKIVGGIEDEQIRDELLAHKNLRYDYALKICRTHSARLSRKRKSLDKENCEVACVKNEIKLECLSGKDNPQEDDQDDELNEVFSVGKHESEDTPVKKGLVTSANSDDVENDNASSVVEFLNENVHQVCKQPSKQVAKKKTESTKPKKKPSIEYYFEENNMIIELSGPEDNSSVNDESDDGERAWNDDETHDEEGIVAEAAQSDATPQKVFKEKRRNGKFICDCCGMQFVFKRGLINHILTSHADVGEPKDDSLVFVCHLCGYNTLNERKLATHECQHAEDGLSFCELCEFKCGDPRAMKTHMLKHAVEKPHVCSICDTRFSEPNTLRKHMASHLSSGQKMMSRLDNDNTCEICGKLFSSKNALKVHYFRHTGEKPFACDDCGYRTVTLGALNSHIVSVHSDDKPFVCSTCGHSFKQKFKLQQHLKTHSGVRPHACEVCGRRFMQASHVKRHMMVHTGAKPHVCAICGHRWTTRDNLKAHMRVHEKNPGDVGRRRPARKRPKKPVVIVVTGSDLSDGSEYIDESDYNVSDAVIHWSEEASINE